MSNGNDRVRDLRCKPRAAGRDDVAADRHPQVAQKTLQRRYMRLVLQHRIVNATELETAGGALCPHRRIEFAFDRSAEGLRFQDHNPRWHTNDVIEFDRPSRTPENDIVKRGEADPL